MKASVICTAAREGFRGFLYEPAVPSGRCMLVLIGDDGNDLMDTACARWLVRHQDCAALCLALRQDAQEDPGINLWNLNIISVAADWLKSRGFVRIGICGMSMQAVIALSASARIPEISLVLAFSPCDYVPWGFRHGLIGDSKNAEYPTGKSLLTWKGQPLPFEPAGQSPEEYWKMFEADTGTYREPHSKGVFEFAEQHSPIPPEAFIPAENIRGAVILVGAEDDSMWNSTRYIQRLRSRLRDREFIFPLKTFTFAYGTHLLVPQRMLTEAIPVLGNLVSLLYRSGRRHFFRCRSARLQLDRKLSCYLQNW